MTEKDRLVRLHMETLGCSKEEAEQLIEDDKKVDRGEPLPWDLTPEQRKNSKAARRATTDPSSRKPRTVVKKSNDYKVKIIQVIAGALQDADCAAGSIVITNAERTVDFIDDCGNSYTITLTAHRNKKN